MVDEALHLRREVPRARIHDVDRRRRRVPVAKHAVELARSQVGRALKRGEQRDAETARYRRVEEIHVADQEARRHRDLDGGPRLFDAQRDVGRARAEQQTVVRLQILG